MNLPPERKIYGLTGEIGRDGVLTPDLQVLLDQKQHEAAQAVLDHLEKRENGGLFPIAAMATGIGKTRVEHEVIEVWRRKNPQARILFIAGTKLTLVTQSSVALADYQQQKQDAPLNGGDKTYTESEDLEADTSETEDVEEALETEQEDLPFYRIGRFRAQDADVRVATIQTIQSAYKKGQLEAAEFDLVIVDEVHNIGTPIRAAIIEQFRNVVGFTATPHRHSGQMKRPEEYGFEVAYNFPLPEAQNSRLLPPLLGMQIATTDLVEEIPITRSGQIDFKRLEQILKKSPDLRPFIADKVADIIRDGDKEYKTVIAVNFVWEAQELAELLKARGIKVGVAVNQQAAKRIHSEEIPALDSIERYKLTQTDPKSIQVLVSPYVASEGFDAPFTEVLVWASPTDSDLRYTQYVGRLARRSEGKLFGLNLDFLYQTSQFGWSYNMGMWMKGSVRQLPSGLLYLGPEGGIAGLAELDVVKTMRVKGDSVDISDLQKEPLEDIKETDLSLTTAGLEAVFVGGKRLASLAQRIKVRIEAEHSEYFAKRKSNTRYADVVTADGRSVFIEAMVAAGAKLKDNSAEDLKDTDLQIAYIGLHTTFRGDWIESLLIAKQVQAELRKEHPEYFATRKNKGSLRKPFVEVVTKEGRQIFIGTMVAKGAKLRDLSIQKLQLGEIPLSREGLASIFSGEHIRLKPIVERIKDRMLKDDPEYFATRKNESGIVEAVTQKGRDVFIQAMLKENIRLQDSSIQNLQEEELPLSYSGLRSIFHGESARLNSLAVNIRIGLEINHPEYFAERRSGARYVDAVTKEGRKTFIEAMVAAGARLKSK